MEEIQAMFSIVADQILLAVMVCLRNQRISTPRDFRFVAFLKVKTLVTYLSDFLTKTQFKIHGCQNISIKSISNLCFKVVVAKTVTKLNFRISTLFGLYKHGYLV